MKKLNQTLKHLSISDRDDIVREIESHIVEKWDTESYGNNDTESLRGVLGKFGTPEAIAAQYCEHRGWAKPPQDKSGWRKTALIIFAILGITVLGVSYFGSKYIIYPFINIFTGTDKIVEINEDEIKIFDGKIKVSGKGIVDIDEDKDNSFFKFSFKSLSKKYLLKEELLTKEIPANNINALNIRNDNGNITVNGSNTNKFIINYTKRIYGNNKSKADEYSKQVNLTSNIKNNTLFLIPEAPSKLDKDFHGYVIDINITVPTNVAADIKTDTGRIEVSNLNKKTKVQTDTGRINVIKINSSIEAKTDTGQIDVEDITGNININTDTGKAMANRISGFAKIKTDTGRISATNIKGGVEAISDIGRISISNCNGDITAKSDVGRLKIDLRDDYEFTMTAKTDVGSIKTDFPTTKQGDTVAAMFGSGKYKLILSSNVGSIDVFR